MDEDGSILASCTSGGCGAKIGPGDLSDLLKKIAMPGSPHLLVGFDASDDACVYRLDDQRSLVSTVDFFSPMVDDPHLFGRIAAANALSDIYAMGATPLVALNIVAFPEHLSKSILGEILAGGAEKITEAQASVGGGHSIYDKEPKYGLAVNGIVDSDKIIRNNTPIIGDALILTKALGVGVIMSAHRKKEASHDSTQRALATMQHLNRYAAMQMRSFQVNACTDVTGFGLLAHLLEMCGSQVSACIQLDQLPLLPQALAYAQAGFTTSAAKRNRFHVHSRVDLAMIDPSLQEILFDPQTSGGLLISVKESDANNLLEAIHQDDPDAKIIGQIIPKVDKSILFI